MALKRAAKLLGGIRPHHLGFGFFWTVTFMVLTGFQNGLTATQGWEAYATCEQIALPVVVGALGIICARRNKELPASTVPLASALLSGAALLYFLTFRLGAAGSAGAVVAGLLMGCASGLFFLMWELFYVTEGQQRALICIPLSAVISIVLYLLLTLLPLPLGAFVTITLLPYLAQQSLQKSLSEIEMYAVSPLDKASLKRIGADLWQPMLCVCVLGFAWKLVAGLGGAGSAASVPAALLGFAGAALVVLGLELFLSKGFNLLHIYQVIFPLLTLVFLVPSLFGEAFTALLVGFLMFGFEIGNLLLIITCAVYTARHMLPSSPLYALCIGPVLASMALGDKLGAALGPALANNVLHGAGILFTCALLLSIALVVVARSKNKAPASVSDKEMDAEEAAQAARNADNHETGSAPSEEQVDPFAHLRERMREAGLSPRETEVAELLMKGHSIAAISNKLFISENTTRGHAKNIYRKLGVHSRQELVDMAEANVAQ